VIADAPDSVDAHVQLATAYNRLKRKDDADRERAIVDRLNREIQAKQPAPESQPQAPSATPPPSPQGTLSEGPRQ
jgi:hypothetical protein